MKRNHNMLKLETPRLRGVGGWFLGGMDVKFRESCQGDAARAGSTPCCFKLVSTCMASSLD